MPLVLIKGSSSEENNIVSVFAPMHIADILQSFHKHALDSRLGYQGSK